jgi:electron transfer flavoprotein alpha subunit
MSVLVFTENWDGKFKKLSYELVSYATKIAEMMNTSATVVSIGTISADELEKLGKYGAKKIISVPLGLNFLDNQLYTRIISEIAMKEGANVIVLSNNNTGKALAPRLSVKLKAGIGAGVTKLPVSTDPFVIYKKVFSGNAFAEIRIKSAIRILTLAQNSFELVESGTSSEIVNLEVSFSEDEVKTSVIEVQKQTGKILLTDAEIVVSGGRGMRGPENWKPIEEMATLLGAATACSRPVSDEGWRPHEEHTGQTGKIISPNLYFAIGISGATQHLAGVSSSKVIVAINTDKDAPIFEAANYGIIGDALKVLPKLVEGIREIKGK